MTASQLMGLFCRSILQTRCTSVTSRCTAVILTFYSNRFSQVIFPDQHIDMDQQMGPCWSGGEVNTALNKSTSASVYDLFMIQTWTSQDTFCKTGNEWYQGACSHPGLLLFYLHCDECTQESQKIITSFDTGMMVRTGPSRVANNFLNSKLLIFSIGLFRTTCTQKHVPDIFQHLLNVNPSCIINSTIL
jgi:hypothetical protein